MKQTAVEWLQWALENTILTDKQEMQTIGLFEQAKAMEKEQIVKSYKIGFNLAYDNAKYDYEPLYNNGENYYQETYNK